MMRGSLKRKRLDNGVSPELSGCNVYATNVTIYNAGRDDMLQSLEYCPTD